MRADDAADAIAELPQSRRQPVIDLLPPGVRTKVLTLMGFNPTSAGGLMGVDYLAVPSGTRVGDALAAVRTASNLQPEALTSVHAVDADNSFAASRIWSSCSSLTRVPASSGSATRTRSGSGRILMSSTSPC